MEKSQITSFLLSNFQRTQVGGFLQRILINLPTVFGLCVAIGDDAMFMWFSTIFSLGAPVSTP